MVENVNILSNSKYDASGDGAAARSRWTTDAGSIVWRTWNDESVVYLEDHATTHLLSAGAGAVLHALLDFAGAMSMDELAVAAFGAPSEAEPVISNAGVPTTQRAGISSQEALPALRTEERAALRAIVLDLERIGVARLRLP